ncbi:hypothetical protein ACVJGD_005466 [Bradyrhizobium sp. USDA 10063]
MIEVVVVLSRGSEKHPNAFFGVDLIPSLGRLGCHFESH